LKATPFGQPECLGILPGNIVTRRRIIICALVVTFFGGVKVKLVALEADKGFVLLQEVIGYSAMGSVTY
jgi:hypothetical protein